MPAEVPLQVDADHGVEVLLAHVEDHLVAQKPALLTRMLRSPKWSTAVWIIAFDVVPVGDVAEVGDRLAARLRISSTTACAAASSLPVPSPASRGR